MKDGIIINGEFIPISCQWKHDDGTQCCNHVVTGKSYCHEHYSKIYEEVPEEYFDEIVDELIGITSNEDEL